MSFCPNKDIHSVYLDNELPEIYKAEYEAHLKECKKCQEELAKLRKIHQLFSSDSSAITPDSHYLDQSFERLQMKMKFSKNTERKSASENKFNFRNVGYVACAAAAAAVFALIIPVRVLDGKNSTQTSMPAVASVASVPMAASNVSLDSGRSVVISGNIHESVLTSGNINASPLARNVNNSQTSMKHRRAPRGFAPADDVELLRPDIETISIKITLPGIDSTPVTTEVNLPMDVLSGRQ